MKTADLFVRALEHEGVSHIFGIPGEENLDLIESLRTSKITFITTRHEQTAGFMAATIGRLTGKAGVALSTLGPGATNLVTPAAFAQLGGMPLVLITGQKPIKKSKQGHFQIIPTNDVLRPVTKFTKQVVNGSSVCALVREAFRLAEEERPGAVHLELPEDVARERLEGEEGLEVFEVKKVRRPVAEEKAIRQAVEMIEAAKHPLILIGAGANRKLTSKMLRECIDTTGIPFFNTQMGKGVVDERHPLYLGCAALSANDYLHCAIDAADLIINVGHDVVEKPPFIMKQEKSQRVIHINFYSAKVDNIYFPQLEVVGDIANAVWQLKERIQKQPHWDFSYFLQAKKQLEEYIRRDAASDRFPMIPQRIVADVRAVMPSDGIVALDNGMYKLWFSRHYAAHEANTLLLDNALATMGAGLATGIAAKLVFPDKKVLVVAGDGGFLMNVHELETAVRLKLDLTVLLLNDNGYGMIQWKQEGMGFGKFGLTFGNPDWVRLAESFGAKGYRVASAAELQPHLRTCLESPGVHVIEVPVDYSENTRVFSKEPKEKICPT